MSAPSSTQSYTMHFVPLESDPELFTELIHSLGASQDLSFQDVYSIDDPELLSFIPKPIHALILILPTTPAYEKRVALEDADTGVYETNDKTIWLSQTINNACGLYAILHAITNSGAKQFIGTRLENMQQFIKLRNPRTNVNLVPDTVSRPWEVGQGGCEGFGRE